MLFFQSATTFLLHKGQIGSGGSGPTGSMTVFKLMLRNSGTIDYERKRLYTVDLAGGGERL